MQLYFIHCIYSLNITPIHLSSFIDTFIRNSPQHWTPINMSPRNIFAITLIIASLVLLYPGVTQPLLQITVSANMPILGSLQFYNETQSIYQSIVALWQHNNVLVAVLILIFSIAIPVLKALLLCIAMLMRHQKISVNLHRFISFISKWSMADVFVVSVFMAFLATQSNDFIEAVIHPGFYYFLSYCVVSIMATQLLHFPTAQTQHEER